MPVKRRQNLAETGKGSFYNEEWLEFLDSKGAFYNGNESNNDVRVTMKITNNSSYRRVLSIVVTKEFPQFFYKN